MKFKILIPALAVLMLLAGCGKKGQNGTGVFPGNEKDVTITLTFSDDGSYSFSTDEAFFSKEQTLKVICPQGETVYYTLDGSVPNNHSTKYTGPIGMSLKSGSIPDAYCFRFLSIKADGTESQLATRTYFVEKDMATRFTIPVISIVGNPKELTTGKDAILVGDNVFVKGRVSERPCYLEAFDADQSVLFRQNGGVRVAGKYSRNFAIKALNIYARKSYDEANKNFKTDILKSDRLTSDEEGYIDSYNKFRLRSGGNDFQFTFVKEELSQTLAKQAGLAFYENFVPVGVYMNGKYYCFMYMHECYNDKYFTEKLGKHEGEFVVFDGLDGGIYTEEKNGDEVTEIPSAIEFNEMMDSFLELDFEMKSTYDKINQYIDLEDYLDYFAFNIVIGNADWPDANFKYYRYEPGDNGTLGDGYFDGRWRFLVHDSEYTYDLYNHEKASAACNDLAHATNPEDERYARFFTALMKNKKAHDYFVEKATYYNETLMTEDNLVSTYNALHEERATELNLFFKYVKTTLSKKNHDIWCNAGSYRAYESDMLKFFAQRQGYVTKMLEDF